MSSIKAISIRCNDPSTSRLEFDSIFPIKVIESLIPSLHQIKYVVSRVLLELSNLEPEIASASAFLAVHRGIEWLVCQKKYFASPDPGSFCHVTARQSYARPPLPQISINIKALLRLANSSGWTLSYTDLTMLNRQQSLRRQMSSRSWPRRAREKPKHSLHA